MSSEGEGGQTESSWKHERSVEAGVEGDEVLGDVSSDGTGVHDIDTVQEPIVCQEEERREMNEKGTVSYRFQTSLVSSLSSSNVLSLVSLSRLNLACSGLMSEVAMWTTTVVSSSL
jgi:hypothetical protein